MAQTALATEKREGILMHGQQQSPWKDLPLFTWQPEEVEPEFPPAYQAPSPTKVDEDAEVLLAYLKARAVGKSNAIRGNDLVALLGFKNPQHLRAVVQSLRNGGHMVLSTIAGGYYIGTSPEEFLEFRRENYLNRMVAMAESANAMLAAARVTYGQPANDIPAVKVVLVPHAELPERLHV